MPFRSPSALRHRLAERDAEILDGVMLIDVEIAGGVDLQVEAAVPREQLQHVIEKADAGADVVAALAFERERQRDLRLGRSSIDYRAAHRTSSNARRCSAACARRCRRRRAGSRRSRARVERSRR